VKEKSFNRISGWIGCRKRFITGYLVYPDYPVCPAGIFLVSGNFLRKLILNMYSNPLVFLINSPYTMEL